MICRSNVNVIQSEGKPRTPLTQSWAATRFHCSFCFYFSSRALSCSINRVADTETLLTHAKRARERRFLSHSPFRFICRTSGAERVSKDIARPRATLGARLRNASPDFKLIKWSSKRRCDTRATPSSCIAATLLFCKPPAWMFSLTNRLKWWQNRKVDTVARSLHLEVIYYTLLLVNTEKRL